MSKFYNAIAANTDGQPFPQTGAINSSGPLVPDGTAILKEVVNDSWYAKQALLDFYDFPPNGLEDFSGVDVGGLPLSQPLAIQYMNYGTPGVIVNWPSEIDPAVLGAGLGIDIRLLLLHGQGIDRTLSQYKMLDSIVYIGDANNATADAYYHANDALGAVRNIAGDYLILDDARGFSFRGLDPSGTIDPDGASRIVGHHQEDALQNIRGDFLMLQKDIAPKPIIFEGIFSGLFDVSTAGATSTTEEVESTPPAGDHDFDQIVFDTSNVAGLRTSIETRGKNIATHYAIHF